MQNLFLQQNQLRSIAEFAFRNLFELRTLNLGYNSIVMLKPTVFRDLTSLR